jgi:hypothetical protein
VGEGKLLEGLLRWNQLGSAESYRDGGAAAALSGSDVEAAGIPLDRASEGRGHHQERPHERRRGRPAVSREGSIERDASGAWFFVVDVTPPGAARRMA